MTIFVPAAQGKIEPRRSHCFFTMSSSNRWTRTSAAETRAKAESSNRRQEFRDSQYDDGVRHSEPAQGYAQRKSEEIPEAKYRTLETLPEEDHLAFCDGYRHQTEWFQAHTRVRQKRSRGIHSLMGPNNLSGFDRHQMFMDVISWILYWGTEHREFDDSLKWIAEFLKYLCGFTTQDEEDWFDGLCNDFHVDLTGRQKDSQYLRCSKSLSGVLRHCKQRSLFTEDGSMNIVDCFNQIEWNSRSPKQYNMSGAQLAAMLLCNPKQRFLVEMYMQWNWSPYSAAATYPFDVRLGARQGHSNQVVDPNVAHHPLTYDEAMSLGWIFHVTDYGTLPSIQQYGLKANVKGSGKGGRDAVHFMYHNDNGQGYIRMAEGTIIQKTSVPRVGSKVH